MKRRFGFLALFFLAEVSLAVSTRGVTDKTVTIGSHTSLSGPAALWGVGSTNAAKMYRKSKQSWRCPQ